MRNCRIIAHRGANVEAPQNTLPAFRQAIEAGTDGFETDVHLTADGVPVICHNATVDATSNGKGYIEALPFETLRSFDFGAWKAPEYAGTVMPTLDEFLCLAASAPSLSVLNIELKSPRTRNSQIVEKTLAAVEAHGLSDKLLISSFNPAILRKVKKCSPTTRTGFLFPCTQLRVCPLVLWPFPLTRLIGADAIHPFSKITDARMIETAHRLGMDVNVWTVDDPAEIRRLTDLGVDGLITNNPANTRNVMEKCFAYLR